MSNSQRILITLRGDAAAAERFSGIVNRSIALGRSINTQILLELDLIDAETAAAIPRAGRRPQSRPRPANQNNPAELEQTADNTIGLKCGQSAN